MSTLNVNRIVDASGGVFAPVSSVFRSRIINGGMVIDQRNAGAAVTVNADAAFFAADRFQAAGQGSDGVYTIQQSSTAPTGFVNSIVATVTTADASIGASQQYNIQQHIEGYNVADLGFGTANAKTVTLSFWVRSSVTGTFSGALRNSAANRSYPFSYTINSANTWEFETITIAGDTTGTWLTTNGTGINVIWTLGAGTSRLGTANSWQAANLQGVTGQTNLIATNGATFFLTGVQLEVGTQATSFEYRQYQQELALCQRYFAKLNNDGTGDASMVGVGGQRDTTSCWFYIKHPVTMRGEPTVAISNLANTDFAVYSTDATLTNTFAAYDSSTIYCSMSVNGAAYRSAGLIIKNNTTGNLTLSSEL